MSSKMPPVPPGSVSPKGPASADRPDDAGRTQAGVQDAAPDQVGQTANTKINTSNQEQ